MISRRQFLKMSVLAGAGLMLPLKGGIFAIGSAAPRLRLSAAAFTSNPTLKPADIPKYQAPLIIPPAMPRTNKLPVKMDKNIDYYEIAVRQFEQQILPTGMPKTTVWSYGSTQYPGTVEQGGSFNYPAFTIEAKYRKPLRVKWINDLVDTNGNYLPHLLPVDQTLHWANPPGGEANRDTRGTDASFYLGPVPIITHVHGGHTGEESDGYPEAWYLPNANNLPDGYAATGTWYDTFKPEAETKFDQAWNPGAAVFQYPNDQRATTLWYHDHTLGMTRLNVYAGPAGFYLLRGGPDDGARDKKGKPAALPGPAPALGDAPGVKYYEIPIVIQDRSFNEDGSLFFPDSRAFFDGFEGPFIPDEDADSDISPIWNPEFFGNTMVVNGRTWPYLEVEQRRYRFRFLNGCNSRFLILKFDTDLPFWQIGADGGFLPQPEQLDTLLLGLAERADVIVDFGVLPAGTTVKLLNIGPDEPFGGGDDFEPADADTTGQVMEFRVIRATGRDSSTPPDQLVLPAITPLGPATNTRQVSLNEEDSATLEEIGPRAALLGTVSASGEGQPLLWMGPITENPPMGATEVWEIYNFTMDAHPIHIHLVQFEVLGREAIGGGPSVAGSNGPLPGETGFKDTVIAYPGEITRVKATFDQKGLYVWHCHIIDHEDNEMMRPYCVGPMPTGM